MGPESSNVDPAAEEGWQIIATGWWRTPYSSISWSYQLRKEGRKHPFSKPPYYHGALYRDRGNGSSSESWSAATVREAPRGEGMSAAEDDDMLNLDHVGVRSAVGVLTAYENDVGFNYCSFPEISLRELGVDFGLDICSPIEEEDVVVGREHWDELVGDLVNGPLFDETPCEDDGLERALNVLHASMKTRGHRATSTLSSIEFTESEHSLDFFVMPSTPKAKSADVHVFVKDASPSSSDDSSIFASPSRPLNATASSFVPSFSFKPKSESPSLPPTPSSASSGAVSPPPETYVDFSFATLNPSPLATVTIKKDAQGFFTEVQVEPPTQSPPPAPEGAASAPSCTDLLPAFMQEPSQRQKSKTRQIVDRLRSQAQGHAPKGGNSRLAMELPVPPPPPPPPGKCVSHSPSPISHDFSFMRPRSSVSEDPGVGRESALSTPAIQEDNDGWWSTGGDGGDRERRKGLLHVLSRRRTDSLGSDVKSPTSDNGSNSIASDIFTTSPSPSPVSTPPSSCNDGWIEVPSVPAQVKALVHKKTSSLASTSKAHKKKPSSHTPHSASHLPAPHPVFSVIPSPYPHIPHAPPAGVQYASPRVPSYFYAYHSIPLPTPYAPFMPVQAPFPLGMHMPRPVHPVGAPVGVQLPGSAAPVYAMPPHALAPMGLHPKIPTSNTHVNL